MKKLLFMICAVMVLSIPAFAADLHFATNSIDQEELYGSHVVYSYEPVGANTIYYFAQVSSGRLQLYGLSTDSSAVCRCTKSSDGSTFDYNISSSYATGWYYGVLGNNYQSISASFDPSITPFASDVSRDDIVSELEEYIANSPTPDVGVQSSFSVPCGNVAYFQVSSAQTVNFKSTYQILSKFFANSTYGYWSDSGQRFGPAASLPTSSTSFPIASQDPLYWTPDPQSKNLLGLSKIGLASESCIIGQWYAFYNPAYNSNNTDWTTMDITGATVLISGSFSEIKIYPLEQVVDYQNGSFVGGSNDDYQSYFDGNIGADGSVSFTDQDGVSSVPTAGGQNLLAPNETAQSLVEKVVGILQNLLSEIQSLFTFGYDAIQSLVGIMSSFVSSFSQLYTWLPTEVYSALISAVIIAVVIGIFKVFL